MRTFENLLLPVDEWFITSTLSLDDNGCFRYQESWSCYAGSVDSEAAGKWRQTESVIVLETERIDGSLRLNLAEGQKLEAFERENCLDFGDGIIMNIKPVSIKIIG